MKYFTLDLLERTNHMNEEVRKAAQEDWERACAAYGAELKCIKRRLPKRLVHRLEEDFFHDAGITQMSICAEKRGQSVYVYFDKFLISGEKVYSEILIHSGVEKFMCTMKPETVSKQGVGRYLYGEIFEEEGLIAHNFIFANGCEINILCSKLQLVEQK